VRGLSAGCPEQDIAARALEALRSRQARVVHYDRTQNYDVLMDMGCGGELEVLIEPLSDRSDWAFAARADTLLRERASGVLATLYRAGEPSVSLPRTRHWLWSAGRVSLDEIADGSLTEALAALAPSLPMQHKPTVLRLSSTKGPCEVLVERLLPPNAALLLGVNATAVALARLLGTLGWDATLVDHRDVAAEAPALLQGVARLHCPPEAAATLPADERTFVVAMTHNLERDIAYLRALSDRPLAYLGAVGARRRAARVFEATGLDARRLRMPAGLDIGSETPEEIALAIAAEMVAVANGTGGSALSRIETPIHR
jgi:xanthine dehydrogenase accessory factor